ncbi:MULTISPECIES: KAP family P-loop NTPase fold protein [Vibrio]|uniref:KAP family P-loop NTPase fold protein n=1 Tax=Vibrio TaxID=662 RepID=UPI0002EBF8F2|nr:MULTISPECIES: P-loop NTPase fold protein [Vibrio]OCH51635.1 NTPase KAP [Vibrio lentus]
MQQYVSIDWSESATINGVVYPEDKLGREKYAQYLSNFLASKGYDKTKSEEDGRHNYVLNLNSEWGSGKTYFLKRWSENLKDMHPVVYVDAWQQDYSDDPLMAVIASMINQLREQAGKSAKDAKFKAPRKLLGLLKAAAPAVAGGLTKRYLGIDPVKIMESSGEGYIGETITDEKGNEIDMGAAASKMVSHLIDEHTAKSEAIGSLKHSIEQWVEAAQANKNDTNKNYPAFVFIDELDRCRPSYAVEMLETIKHIFDIPGVVFVVATDTIQLQHAVKAMYGVGFNADVYLGRFFDARYSLKQMPYDELLATHCNMETLSFSNLVERDIQVWPTCNIDAEKTNLAVIYRAFEMSPREAIQTTERLISVINGISKGKNINLYFLAMLMCFSVKKRSHYDRMQNKSLLPNGLDGTFLSELESELSWKGHVLELYIEPRTYVDHFSSDPSANGGMINQFENGTYEVEIREFFIAVHCSVFNLAQSKRNADAARSQFYNLLRERKNGYGTVRTTWQEATQSHINGWIRLITHQVNDSGQVGFDFYQDLVDLSTSLEV